MNEILEALNDPHTRHAMLVHLPIVLTPVALLLLIWGGVRMFKKRTPLVLAAIALTGSTLGAVQAVDAGEESIFEISVEQAPISGEENEALHRHEELGEGAWMWPAGCLALTCIALVRKPKWLAPAVGLLALLATMGVTARFAWTAHTGGALVYEHGLGVPQRGR